MLLQFLYKNKSQNILIWIIRLIRITTGSCNCYASGYVFPHRYFGIESQCDQMLKDDSFTLTKIGIICTSFLMWQNKK